MTLNRLGYDSDKRRYDDRILSWKSIGSLSKRSNSDLLWALSNAIEGGKSNKSVSFGTGNSRSFANLSILFTSICLPPP